MRLIVFMLSVMLALPLHAMDIVVGDSTLGFSVLVGERAVTGEFNDWTAEIDLEASEIKVTIRTASATTNDALLDAVLHGAAWLDSQFFPEAHFTAADIAESPEGHLVTGVLAVKDTQIPLAVTILHASENRPHHLHSACQPRPECGRHGSLCRHRQPDCRDQRQDCDDSMRDPL